MGQENLSAFHYNREIIKPFISLCKPIFEHSQIKYFRYMRVYENGNYISLGNKLDYLNFYLDKVQHLSGVFEPVHTTAFEEKLTYFLWPDELYSIRNKSDFVLNLLHSFNVWHGLSVYKKNGDYVESWNFAGDVNSYNLKHFFMNNQKVIEHFIHYFQQHFLKFYEHDALKAMAKFNKPLQFQNNDDNLDDNILIQKLQLIFKTNSISDISKLNNMNYKNSENNINNIKNNIILTVREKECLELITKGRTMKEIGKILNISPRTAEFHIYNLKSKLGVSYKSELIDFFERNL